MCLGKTSSLAPGYGKTGVTLSGLTIDVDKILNTILPTPTPANTSPVTAPLH